MIPVFTQYKALGPFDFKKYASKFGKIEKNKSSNGIYFGEMNNEMYNGYGILVCGEKINKNGKRKDKNSKNYWEDFCIKEGHFRDGRLDGHGRIICNDGKYYVGQFINGDKYNGTIYDANRKVNSLIKNGAAGS